MSLNMDDMAQYFNDNGADMTANKNDIESPPPPSTPNGEDTNADTTPVSSRMPESNKGAVSTTSSTAFFPATSPIAPASNVASATTATPKILSQSHHGTAVTTNAAAVAAVRTKGLSQSHHGNAPEPPKWRFVSDAKKSCGYNSLAAGKYVRGKSADDLGAKYTAPDVSLYRHEKIQEDPSKMTIREWKRKEDEMPEVEEFSGLPKVMEKENDVKKGFKEWDVHYPIGPKKGRTTEWWDGQIEDFYKVGDDGFPDARIDREVGNFKHGEGPFDTDDFSGQYLRDKKGNEECKQNEDGDIVKGLALAGLSTNSSDTFNSETELFPKDHTQRQLKKRQCCLLLLILLPLLIAVIVMGAILSKEESQEKAEVAGAIFPAGIVIFPVTNSTNSTAPSTAPSTVASVSPSAMTNIPSIRPTMPQTNLPTPKPSCSTNKDFNLCIALDMSGSVCNSGLGFECNGCGIFCQSFLMNSDTCCYNFESVADFSKSMVTSLGEFPADKSFSVVQFATDASLVKGLSSVEQTMASLNRLDYSGGLTNHVDAITLCQQSLSSSSFPDRKNFIMLVTDGGATVPEFNPEVAAEAAATNAKDAGTFVIPVFISPSNDLTTLSFMSRMSSDGQVFDVGDFESLNSLQERLVNQVSCQT